METITGFESDRRPEPSVLALGNFDGVHTGHLSLLERALSESRQQDLPAAVAVFEPHPRCFFTPDSPPFRLMSVSRRANILESLGFDRLHILPFDATMAARTPDDFVRDVLNAGMAVNTVLVGRDFRFGKGRSGDFDTLATLCSQHGITAIAADLAVADGEKISSSQIRSAISEGRMTDAAHHLGRPFIIDGKVELGDQRGRTIGFPTANIAMGDFVRPAYGVYAVRLQCGASDHSYGGVANVGVRPTVDGLNERLEVHIFEFDQDIYGQDVAVSFHAHIRGEQKFDGLDALKTQIARDCDAAKSYLAARDSGPA